MSIATLSLAPSAARFLVVPYIRHKVTPFFSGRASLSFPTSSTLPIGDSCEEVVSTSFLSSSTSYLESVPSASRRLVGAGMCLSGVIFCHRCPGLPIAMFPLALVPWHLGANPSM
ncbi:hypothetical protein ZIOFF_060947 [Zingiber officinale]|uniref:Uncharacterized protein n=1 Tax=Zingiber officinale TaxID=94328 RepID=A0A8J5F717_ZINOF|nr:hypothetical protein ZIOFF_060947 [Zingiber officinale]